ncbi:MAG: isochorismatase family protein [Candidatus Baltobacteraceae bacterium]
MPVTAIDPNTALVVIDMQKGILRRSTVHPPVEILRNVVRLVDAFRAKQLPVVLVRVGWAPNGIDSVRSRTEESPPSSELPPDFFELPPDFSEYADDLRADPSRDILIYKRQWGAFYGTDLDLHLRRRGVTQLVLCGISTSIGVESTARDAWERGYNLTFASDAMTDLVAEAHERALKIIFPRLGEIGAMNDILEHI